MTEQREKFRAGDVVSVGGDRYTLAVDEHDGLVWPAGWPCSPFEVEVCTLIRKADDETRERMLRQAAGSDGTRAVLARRQLGDVPWP